MELRVCGTCRQVHPGLTTCPACRIPLTLADERLFLGETFGKYRLDAVLGAGGMGIVYRATHRTLERPAAVKVLLPELEEAAFRKRFLREAQVLADLKHPNIVEIYDYDVSRWGSPYYVMEYLQGATLRGLLRGEVPAPLPLLAPILRDVGAGLGFAHRKGVVHRDLKPENIFVADFDGRALTKILDFGIAKLLSSDKETTHLTTTGAVVGTPNYLAPEQILGQDVGAFTDQYALALIVAEFVSGKPVRAGKTLGQIIREEINRPLDAGRLPEDLPRSVKEVLIRATEPDPAARFPNVGSFLDALELPSPEEGSGLLSEALARLGVGEAPLGTDSFATRTTAGPKAAEAETEAVSHATATVHASSPPPPSGGTDALPPAGTSAPVVAEPPTATARARLIRLCVATGSIALLTLILGLAAWRWWPWTTSPPAPRPQPAAGGGETGPLGHRRDLTVPPDVSAILAAKGDTIVLLGGGAFYLLPQDGSQPATRVSLGEGQTSLGSSIEGDLWLMDGSRVLATDPLTGKNTVWVEKLPERRPFEGKRLDPRVVLSRSGKNLALLQPSGIDVYEIREKAYHRRFSVPWDPSEDAQVALTEKYIVTAQGRREVAAHRLVDGRRVFAAPLREARIHALAVLDDADLLAVGGWFDHVDVFELTPGGKVTTIPRHGETKALEWIADHPTLVIGGPAGLALWRAGEGEVASWGTSEHEAQDALATGSVVASLDAQRHKLSLLDYGSLPSPRRIPVAKAELWAVASAPGGRDIFAGGKDGVLYAYRTDAGGIEPYALHSDGITDLVLHGEHLASTSDDKTIAIWQLPRLNVTWRSQAHQFLVNQMFLQGDPPTLWSSSSDGTVKQWTWPRLEERESLDTQRLLGRKYALQSIWVDAAGSRVLAGTWNHALIVFHRQSDGTWKARTLPVASGGLYRSAALGGLDAVLLVGVEPSVVYVYDVRGDRLHTVPSLGHRVYVPVVPTGGSEAYVLGEGSVLRYVFERQADGAISYAVTARVQTRLGTLLAASSLDGRGQIAAGNEVGELMIVDRSALKGPPIAKGLIAPGP